MDEAKRPAQYYYYFFLVKYLLPIEAKYTSLRGKKDWEFVEAICKYYIENILPNKNPITVDDFKKKYLDKLLSLLSKQLYTYIDILSERVFDLRNNTYNEKLKGYILKFKNNEIDEIDFIKELEKLLGIYEEKNNLIGDNEIFNHVFGSKHLNIYSEDVKNINHLLAEFITAYRLIEEYASSQDNKKNNIADDSDYIKYIVLQEFLSFLAHYSMGITYFGSPRVFINNLGKSSSHLKRAIMDVYDALIIENGFSKDLQFLKIRHKKINSLGNNEDINVLMNELKEYFFEKFKRKQLLEKRYKRLNNLI